jgi:hypothetical protein
MSNNPPFIGARYEAAHDLSEMLDDQTRPEQFRPFIPYQSLPRQVCASISSTSGASKFSYPACHEARYADEMAGHPISMHRVPASTQHRFHPRLTQIGVRDELRIPTLRLKSLRRRLP